MKVELVFFLVGGKVEWWKNGKIYWYLILYWQFAKIYGMSFLVQYIDSLVDSSNNISTKIILCNSRCQEIFEFRRSTVKSSYWFVYLRNMYGCTESVFLAYLCFSTWFSEDIQHIKGYSHGIFPTGLDVSMLDARGRWHCSSDARRIKQLPSLKPTASSPLTTDGWFRWISLC